ncbi:TMEM165/GDT1 family protein, partial [bacterium]
MRHPEGKIKSAQSSFIFGRVKVESPPSNQPARERKLLIRSFLETFGLVFTAEMGDKTQLMVMTLAANHPWASVFLGSATAFALLGVMAVAIGPVLFLYVNPLWV